MWGHLNERLVLECVLAKSMMLQGAPLPLPDIDQLDAVRSRAIECGAGQHFHEWLT